MTVRGIPQIYYGTEIGLVGGEGHSNLRVNFPGGFPGDQRNAFTPSGRTSEENDTFEFVKKLIHLRKNYKALSEGKFTHFPPVNEVYFYFRIYKDEKILVMLNNSSEKQKIVLNPLTSLISPFRLLINLESGERIDINQNKEITVDSNTGYIFLLTN